MQNRTRTLGEIREDGLQRHRVTHGEKPGYAIVCSVPKSFLANIREARDIFKEHRVFQKFKLIRETRTRWVAVFYIRIMYLLGNGEKVEFKDYGGGSSTWWRLLKEHSRLLGESWPDALASLNQVYRAHVTEYWATPRLQQ